MITWLIDMGYITKASKGRFKLDYIIARQFIEQKLQDSCRAVMFDSVGPGVVWIAVSLSFISQSSRQDLPSTFTRWKVDHKNRSMSLSHLMLYGERLRGIQSSYSSRRY